VRENFEDHYAVLGVSRSAELVVIAAAYRALAKKYHPDKWTGDQSEANFRMVKINEAYSVLSDSDKRKLYDELLKQRAETAKEDAGDAFRDAQSRRSDKPRTKKTTPPNNPRSGFGLVVVALEFVISVAFVIGLKFIIQQVVYRFTQEKQSSQIARPNDLPQQFYDITRPPPGFVPDPPPQRQAELTNPELRAAPTSVPTKPLRDDDTKRSLTPNNPLDGSINFSGDGPTMTTIVNWLPFR
jgi:curved DNA-binding protein CbpA